MVESLEIRESAPADLAAIELLYPEAFPDEDLLPLVRDLLREASAVLSLIGIFCSRLVGHVIFTKCSLVGSNASAALLGPLAVAPAQQRQGVGSAIVRAGLRRLEDADVSRVYVLGDPAYYGRLGFLPESCVMPQGRQQPRPGQGELP
jgi:putative acetyltransferase